MIGHGRSERRIRRLAYQDLSEVVIGDVRELRAVELGDDELQERSDMVSSNVHQVEKRKGKKKKK